MFVTTGKLFSLAAILLLPTHLNASNDQEPESHEVTVEMSLPQDMKHEVAVDLVNDLQAQAEERGFKLMVRIAVSQGTKSEIKVQSPFPLPDERIQKFMEFITGWSRKGKFARIRNELVAQDPEADFMVQVYTLRNFSAESANNILRRLHPGPLYIIPELRTNSLIVRGAPDDLKLCESLIEALEEGSDFSLSFRGQRVRIFRLQHANSDSIASVANALFGNSGPTVTSNPGSNSILARGSAAELDELSALIRRLDDVATTNNFTKDVDSALLDTEAESVDLDDLRRRAEQLERTSIELARDTRDAERVHKAVADSFSARQQLQRAELQHLARRMKELQARIELQGSSAKEIIERRVSELLDPNLDWDVVFPPKGIASTERVSPNEQRDSRQQVVGKRGEQTPSQLKAYALKHISASDAYELLSPMLAGKSDVKLARDDEKNRLLLMATHETHHIVGKVLERFDTGDSALLRNGVPGSGPPIKERIGRQLHLDDVPNGFPERIIQDPPESWARKGVRVRFDEPNNFIVSALSSEDLDSTVRYIQKRLDEAVFQPAPIQLPTELATWLAKMGYNIRIDENKQGQSEYRLGNLHCSDGRFVISIGSNADGECSVEASALTVRPSFKTDGSADGFIVEASGNVQSKLGKNVELQSGFARMTFYSPPNDYLPKVNASNAATLKTTASDGTRYTHITDQLAIFPESHAYFSGQTQVQGVREDGKQVGVEFYQNVHWDLQEGKLILQ